PPHSPRFPYTTLFRALRMMVECAKVSQEVFAQKAFDPYRGAPIFPERDGLSDADFVDFIRAKAETVYHPVGTCRMGSDDDAVVEDRKSTRLNSSHVKI